MTTPIARDEFPVLERWIPLNHAGVSPMPRSVAAAMRRHGDDAMANGSGTIEDRFDTIEGIRARAGWLMGAFPTEVAFVKNTTEGIGFVAEGFPWQPGDWVVVPDAEFPSNFYPWLHLRDRGVRVIVIEADEDDESISLDQFRDVLERGQGRVRMVATSWVQWGRGWRVDLERLADLCHDHGALLCVDIIQGLGAIPLFLLDVGVDFAVAGAQKWLLGPEGVGLLYVREPNLDLLRPLEAGWHSTLRRGSRSMAWQGGALRFEGGIPNVAGIIGLGAAINLISRAGVDAIWRHIETLTLRLADGLEKLGAKVTRYDDPEHRSGIVSFEVPRHVAHDLYDDLEDAGVLLAERGDRLRVSPHAYNDESDVDRFLDILGQKVGASSVASS